MELKRGPVGRQRGCAHTSSQLFTSASLLVTEQSSGSGNVLVTQSAALTWKPEFTRKFLSVDAAFKVSELENNRSSIQS